MSSSNGSTRGRPSSYVRKPQHADERRARARRISRQVHQDEQHRPPPAITLPRLSCLEDCPDVDANASRPR